MEPYVTEILLKQMALNTPNIKWFYKYNTYIKTFL